MAELKVGGAVIPLKASPLSLLFYRQEFDRDMMADFIGVFVGFIRMVPGAEDLPLEELGNVNIDSASMTAEALEHMQLDGLTVLQLAWAMAKAAHYGQGAFPSFEPWLASLEDLPVFDNEFLTAVLEVAADGLFRADRDTRVLEAGSGE